MVTRNETASRDFDPDIVELYLDLAAEALGRASQYRTGLESRMHRLWNSMSAAERDAVRKSW